jgi:NTE family protein
MTSPQSWRSLAKTENSRLSWDNVEFELRNSVPFDNRADINAHKAKLLESTVMLSPLKLEDGIALSMSGGGYRALVFHLGALHRLNEVGLLRRIERISSVSGGSLAAAALALGWSKLEFDQSGKAKNFVNEIGKPILRLASTSIDTKAILMGLLPFQSTAKQAAKAFDKFLCSNASLQDLPDSPRFVFVATSLQTGSIWRFSKAYGADYRVGQWKQPNLPLSTVLSASAGFPPFLSPCEISVPANAITKMEGNDLHEEPFISKLVLTDGGVYDNLGLEPVWKRYKNLLISDGGALTLPTAEPKINWLSQALRVNSIALQQVIFLRRRYMRDANIMKERNVAFWSISEPNSDKQSMSNILTAEEAAQAAVIPTRLKGLSQVEQRLLLRSGYAHCSTGLSTSSIPFVNVEPNKAEFCNYM